MFTILLCSERTVERINNVEKVQMKHKKSESISICCRACSLKAGPNDIICGRFYIGYINPKEKIIGVRCATCGEVFNGDGIAKGCN